MSFGPRTAVGGRTGLPHRWSSLRTLALVPWLISAATVAGGDAPGPRPTGAGSFPVSYVHAAAWFVHGADEAAKPVTLVVFFEGTPGWHAKTSHFRWSTGDTSVIDMNVGPTPIHVMYRVETGAVRVLDRDFTLARDNVFLVTGIDGPAPVVKGVGRHDLTFEPKDNPAVALLARNALVRNALIGESPTRSAKGGPKRPPPEDLASLDLMGIQFLRKGTPEGDRTACEHFRKAAARGYAPSQYRLGYCYEAGRGVDQDSRTANQWFLKAAEQDHVDAQYKLAYSYRVGRGITADSIAALKWYTRAAEQGDAEAQSVLGHMYATGQGARVDAGQAFAWCLKAAENGVPPAQLEIVRRYRDGDGVAIDLASAYRWLSVVRADPEFSAASNPFVESLESRLDQGARARAVASAHEFCRAHARRYVESLGK